MYLGESLVATLECNTAHAVFVSSVTLWREGQRGPDFFIFFHVEQHRLIFLSTSHRKIILPVDDMRKPAVATLQLCGCVVTAAAVAGQ